jgi:Amt family ammonium transporter
VNGARKGWKILAFAALTLAVGRRLIAAEPVEPPVSQEMFTVNNLWMLVATFMVFIMHLGFATLESGLTRAKNTVNILFKNTAIVALGLLTYALLGFKLMYPAGVDPGGVFHFAGLGLDIPHPADAISYAGGHYTYWTDFIFQAMFAATAATIVSGAVAERVKLSSFLIFSAVYVAFIYPLVGMWHWGQGWLSTLGSGPFHDFAGSTIVHSVGGWAALAAIMLLGARRGKYANSTVRPIPGHSMPLAAIGMFLLWFGWYGFNGGSVLSADPGAVSLVFVTTSLGAAAGVVGAMVVSWIIQDKPDLSMVLNGALAGLVSITAGADVATPMGSIIIGLVGGVLVVLAVLLIDTRLRLDDPVGATSVHLCCGVWGTLAAGLFGAEKVLGIADTNTGLFYGGGAGQLTSQLVGVLAVGATCLAGAFLILGTIKASMGLRVSPEEELRGLDIGEHGMEAYGGFQIFVTQ